MDPSNVVCMYIYVYMYVYMCVCVCVYICMYETLPELRCNLLTGQFEMVVEEPVVDWHCKLKRPVRGIHSQSRV